MSLRTYAFRPWRAARAASIAAVTCLLTAIPGSQGYSVVTDLVYAIAPSDLGQPVQLALDLYLPDGGGPARPLVVWFHGGSWSSGDKSNPTAEPLASNGYAVASVNYRLSTQAIWPAQLHDCKGAIRWLRANASAYNIDADRIATFGPSAGGHLAAMLALTGEVSTFEAGSVEIDIEGTSGGNLSQSSQVQVAVDWFGPTDFVRMPLFPGLIDHTAVAAPEALLLGGPLEDLPVLAASANPSSYLSADDPAMLLMHGTLDPVVPLDQSLTLYERGSQGWGLDFRFLPIMDEAHGGPAFDIAEVRAFLDEWLLDLPNVKVAVQAIGSSLSEEGPNVGDFFRVTRTTASATPLTVELAWNGTATNGVDYQPLRSQVVIPAGQTFADITATPIDDALVEGTETIRAVIAPSRDYRIIHIAPSASFDLTEAESTAGLPIVTAVSLDDYALEGSGDSGLVRIARPTPGATALPIRVRMRGSADPGRDYVDPGTLITIPAQSLFADVSILPLDDDRAEGSEYALLEILPGSGYVVGAQGSATVTFRDDDTGLPALSVTPIRPGGESAVEDGVFIVYTSTTPATPLHIDLQPSGEATPGYDYQPLPWGLNVTSVLADRVDVNSYEDLAPEDDERIVLNVVPTPEFIFGPRKEATLPLKDNDAILPADPALRLRVPALTPGRNAVVSLEGHAGALYVLYGTQLPFFFAAPGISYPVLISPIALLTLGVGNIDAFGRAVINLQVPSDSELYGRTYLFQALSLHATQGIDLSNRAQRLLVRQ